MSEFKRTARKLTPEEVRTFVDDWAVLKLGNATEGIPKDTQFIAKIVEPIEKIYVEQMEKDTYYFKVKYDDGLEEPVFFKVRVSEAATQRVIEKHGEDYVGKRAFFTKNSWKGNIVHHVNIITKDQETTKPEFKIKGESDKETPVVEVEAEVPKKQEPELPKELHGWVVRFDTIKEDFKSSFCQDGNYPKTFVEWVQDEESCGTDYFNQFQGEELRAVATKVYYAIRGRLGL
jgi:hypothetical protein